MNDRKDLTLPNNQNELIRLVANSVKSKRTILVIMSGGPVDISEFDNSFSIQAIIWSGYPG